MRDSCKLLQDDAKKQHEGLCLFLLLLVSGSIEIYHLSRSKRASKPVRGKEAAEA